MFTPYFTLPSAYCNWLHTPHGHRPTPSSTFLHIASTEVRSVGSAELQRICRVSCDCWLTFTPPCQLNKKKEKAPTQQTSTYLLEKSRDRLTRTKANNAAEAPYPLNAGHDGELNDLERMRHPAVVLSGPAVYIGLCVRVCDCVRMCACACGQMFSDIHTRAWPHFLVAHLCAVLPLPLSVL